LTGHDVNEASIVLWKKVSHTIDDGTDDLLIGSLAYESSNQAASQLNRQLKALT
jgi:hypothetical protein